MHVESDGCFGMMNGWLMERMSSSGDYAQDFLPSAFPLAHDCYHWVKMNADAFPVIVESWMQHFSCVDEAQVDVYRFHRENLVSLTAYIQCIYSLTCYL